MLVLAHNTRCVTGSAFETRQSVFETTRKRDNSVFGTIRIGMFSNGIYPVPMEPS